MARSITVIRKRGRPKTTGTGQLVGVRLLPPLLSALDSFIATEDDSPSRPEAIRRLLDDDMKRLGHLKIERSKKPG
jgi:hypothetical protein